MKKLGSIPVWAQHDLDRLARYLTNGDEANAEDWWHMIAKGPGNRIVVRGNYVDTIAVVESFQGLTTITEWGDSAATQYVFPHSIYKVIEEDSKG